MPEGKSHKLLSLKDIPETAWQNLGQKRIFFGHQSVGDNILKGIKALKEENQQIKINIVKAMDPTAVNTSGIIHFWVGENGNLNSKIDAFTSYMDKGKNSRPDIAFFKFCFVDFSSGTDVQMLLRGYKSTMEKLQRAFPETTFVHVTVPLTCMPAGIEGWTRRAKNLIKQVIGRPVFDLHDNSKRHEFNELMRKEYEEKAPFFDLAGIESTFRDGRRASYSKDGRSYDCLVPEYTYDGGHLNDLGSKTLAEQLLIFLANLPGKSPAMVNDFNSPASANPPNPPFSEGG